MQVFTTQSVPMLIAAARRRIKQIAWEQFRPYGVTPQQAGVMLALEKQDGISLTELAQQMHLDNPTACRMVNALAKRKLLETRADPHDRRRFRLHLTASGKRLGKQLSQGANKINGLLERKLDARDRAQLQALLSKFVTRLEEADEPPARSR